MPELATREEASKLLDKQAIAALSRLLGNATSDTLLARIGDRAQEQIDGWTMRYLPSPQLPHVWIKREVCGSILVLSLAVAYELVDEIDKEKGGIFDHIKRLFHGA